MSAIDKTYQRNIRLLLNYARVSAFFRTIQGVLVLSVSALFFVSLLLGLGQKSYRNIALDSGVSVLSTSGGLGLTEGSSVETVNDGNPKTYWLGHITDEGNWIQLDWSSKINPVYLELYFSETMYASDFVIQFANNGSLADYASVEENISNIVIGSIKAPISTEQFRILLKKPSSQNSVVGIHEIRIFSFVNSINLLLKYVGNFIGRILLSFLFLAFIFFPGVYITYLFTKDKRDYRANPILSFLTGFLSVFLVSVLALSLGVKQVLLLYPFMFLLLAFFIIRKSLLAGFFRENKSAWEVLFLGVSYLVTFQFVIYTFFDFQYQADYLIPHGVAKAFMENFSAFNTVSFIKHIISDTGMYDFLSGNSVLKYLWGWHVSDRPPLVALVSLPFLYLFGDNFFVFEQLNVVFCTVLLVPLIFISKNLVSKINPSVAALFFIVNSHYVFESFMRPNRWFSAFFILVFYYYVMKKERSVKEMVYAGIAGGLSYLAHSSSLFFCVGGFMYLLFGKGIKIKLQTLGKTIVAGVAMALFVLPWTFWAGSVDRITPFYLFPLAVYHWGQIYSPELLVLAFLQTPLSTVVLNRFWNILNLVIYDAKAWRSFNVFEYFGNSNYSFYTLWGASGLILFWPSVWIMIKGLFSKVYRSSYLFLITAPIIIQILIIGWYAPLDAVGTIQTVVPLFIILGLSFFYKFGKKIMFAVYTLTLLEHWVVLWKYYRPIGIPAMSLLRQNPQTFFSLGILTIYYVFFSVYVWKTLKSLEVYEP